MPTMRSAEYDARFRAAAFAWLSTRSDDGAPMVTREELLSFCFEGERIPLIDHNRGIRRPKVLRGAVSLLTTYRPSPQAAPYEDAFGEDGLLRYKYRSTDPQQADNRAVRGSMEDRLPMIWFYGIAQSQYLAIFPVYAVAEEATGHQFVVSTDVPVESIAQAPPSVLEREYRAVQTYRRVHQPVFRARVMHAYERRCAMCRLAHPSLLDAAHIRRDKHPMGIPAVSNGMALCKIHHAAYDQDILGVRPDLKVEVRLDILHEVDGPMLRHGLQEMAGVRLEVPRSRVQRPDPSAIEERYTQFTAANR
ncbi:HNH endonuclease [Actinocrinis puniceicyclus]|uniref:HNH endonuclease n=1 Tax=Actinocrinis puniceicyclus TaxID=977794 RepID=A0A8J8BBU6_9ACTN|nr:HNH endonuclease [Actinocrinis puniceicyclus]MBS2962451.1 HNH endonuclease [Actinocrinis puniceicyclus]